MKIEKGKLYYCISGGNVIKSAMDWDDESNDLTNKIAVHCPTKEDRKFISEKINLNFDDDSITREVFYLDDDVTSSYDDYKHYYKQEYKLITIDEFKRFYHEDKQEPAVKGINTQPHYDNTHGSLYQIAEQRGWNSYQFDIVKRIDRALKKGQFKEDLQKTKDLIDLWLKEVE